MIDVNPYACPENHQCAAVSSWIDEELCTDWGVCTQVRPVFSQVPDAVGVR